MTTTTILNGVTLTAAGAEATNISKVTLQAGTVRVAIEAKLTTSAGEGDQPKYVDVFFVLSSQDVTANAAARTLLIRMAKKLRVQVPENVGSVCKQTEAIEANGAFLYLWVDHSMKNATSTLSVYSNETL